MVGLFDFLDGDNNVVPGGLLGGLPLPGATPLPPTIAPALASPGPQTPQADGGFTVNLADWLGKNSDLLIAMGAGLASGKDWGDGLGKAGALALQARRSNQQSRQQQQGQLALARMLLSRGANAPRAAVPRPAAGVPRR